MQREIDDISESAFSAQAQPHRLELSCTPLLPETCFRRIVRTLALDSFKWDTQVEDACSIAQFGLIVSRATWIRLAAQAEAMTRELLAVERELQRSRRDLEDLGVPRCIGNVVAGAKEWSPSATRVIRYDFHATTQGWRVSEANSDVPGGYSEASVLPRLVREVFDQYELAGDPAGRLIDSLQAYCHDHCRIGLVAAPGYIEDQQIVAFVASLLRERGVHAIVCRPEQLDWTGDGHALVWNDGCWLAVDALFRFFQAEWLAALPARHWDGFFVGGKTPVCNPGSAILTESKRLPVILPMLETKTPTLRALTPKSVAADLAHLVRPEGWVFKPAYSNNGDNIFSRWSGGRDHRLAAVCAILHSKHWIAQEQFETVPLETPLGKMYPCLGVYTIDGKAAGIYGRVSSRPIIDYTAKDTAVLVDDSS